MNITKLTAPTKEELDAKVKAYLIDYHPAGYGTKVVRRGYEEPNGEFFAVVHRSSSCD